MASVASPYGFRPVGVLTGPYNAQFRKVKIASGYATAIYTGDLVRCETTGTVILENGTSTALPVGVFMGCEYTNPITGQKLQSPYWPASTVAADAYAFVFDNPFGVLQVQANGAIPQADLFENIAISTYLAGDAKFGLSKVTVDAGTNAITNTLPLKIIGFVDGPDSAPGDAYTDILVTYNSTAGHAYMRVLGV